MKIILNNLVVILTILCLPGLSNPLPPSHTTRNSPDILSEPSRSRSTQEAKVWESRNQCEKVIENGGQLTAATTSTLRLGTWNLRWFPIGNPDDNHRENLYPTDLEWLVCTIIWMHLDILAIQESLDTPEAQKAWKRVKQSLRKRTGETWNWTPQRCGRPDDHHIGYLWNAHRVTLSQFDSLWQFNVKAESPKNPCKGGLRPGYYAWVQPVEDGGADFHLIALHLKSGPTVFAVEKRHRALNQIDKVVLPLLEQDQDVVILGDFNTMGAGDWNSQGSELKSVRRQVAKEKPGFKDLPPVPQCTHYFRGRGSWLDHVVVSKEMKEVIQVSSRVSGYCAAAGCDRIRGDYPLAYRQLSDHCPLIIEIRNRDED